MKETTDCLDTPPRCGAFALDDGSLCWRVWAPNARVVELLLYNDKAESVAVPMKPESSGYFAHEEPAARDGQRYAYRLDGGPPRPDPCSRWQPDGVHRPSAVQSPERFYWSEGKWSGVRRDDLVIYELHVGTFTAEGTFDAVIPRLDALRELGITAIELMPVAQFPGERGWGYDGVHPFATQNSYGGPHGLLRLVNACHRAGLGVILDVVYNHVGPEGNYLAEFGSYFTDRHHTPWGKALNFDDRGCDAVREFVLNNVRQWVRDFRMDGLRLDAVHAIFDFSPRHILRDIKLAAADEAARLGRPVHIIAESNLNDVRLLNPVDRGGYGLDAQWSDNFHHCVHALLTGERDGYYADFGSAKGSAKGVGSLFPERPDGCFAQKTPDPFFTARLLVKAINQTFVYDGSFSKYRGRRHGASAEDHSGDRFVVSIQTHDQVGNRACGDRFGTLLEPAQQRLAAGLMLLAPHVPLLFMGEEYGETRPFPFFCSFSDPELIEAVRRGRREEFRDFKSFDWQGDIPDPHAEATFQTAKLTWSWPDGTHHAGLRRLYHDLLTARRAWTPLRDFKDRIAELLPDTTPPGVLRLTRGSANTSDTLVAYFNLATSEQPIPTSHSSSHQSRLGLQTRTDGSGEPAYKMLAQRGGSTAEDSDGYIVLLSSESSEYGGSRTANDTRPVLLPFEFRVYGPITWTRSCGK